MGKSSAADAARVDRDVAQLFNAVQRSSAATERCVKHLWKIAQQCPEEAIQALAGCIELVLTAGQKTAPVERCVRFLAAIAAAAPANETGDAFMEALLHKLASHLGAADRGVRFRAAQALAGALQALPAGACIEEGLAQQLLESLALRLRDKAGDVRQCAARALGRLPEADEAGSYADDPATCALIERLGQEKNKDVRAVIVMRLPMSQDTKPVLLERLRDVAPAVRKAAVARLCSVPPSLLSIQQRARLLGVGLRDRDATVKAAAEAGLARWLRDECGGDALALLELLDVETYSDEAALALESLLASGALDASALAKDAAARGGGLRGAAERAGAGAGGAGAGAGAALMQPAEALMWRCVCEWLQKDAIAEGLAAAATTGASAAVRAAAASHRHEVLEAILPESAASTAALLLAHAAGGPRHRFAATQLAAVAATCLDWADASSRRDAADALQVLIAQDPRVEEAADFGGADSDGGGADSDGGGGGGGGADKPRADGPPLFGNGGDGRYEEALARLAAAVHAGGPRELLRAMLDGAAGLAAKAGLLRKPGMEGGDDGMEDAEDYSGEDGGAGGVAEPCQWLQLLQYVSLSLRALPAPRPPPPGAPGGGGAWDVAGGALTLQGAWDSLLLPAVRHASPAVRAKALECAALYCLARPAPGALAAAALLMRRALVAAEASEVKAAAARGLTDLFLTLGPVAVESVLIAAASSEAGAAESAADGGDGRERTPAGGEDAQWRAPDGRGLVQLLTAAAAGALEGAERGAGGPAKAAASRPSAAPAELPYGDAALLAAAAEALAKLLLHQRLWLPAAAAAAAAAPGGAGCPSADAAALRRALSALLLLHFHPATEGELRLRQCLSVFFDVLASSGDASLKRALAAAALPAARAAHALGGGRAAAARQPAPAALRFVLQLLLQGSERAPPGGDDDGGDDDDAQPRRRQRQPAGAAAGAAGAGGDEWGAPAFAQQLLVEADHVWRLLLSRGVAPARNRPYAAALMEVAAALPLRPGCDGLGVLLVLAQQLEEACAPDTTLAKHAAALMARFSALEAEGAAPPDESELEEVIGQLRGMCVSMEPGLAGAGGGVTGAAAAAATPSASRGRGRPRGGGARGAAVRAAAPASAGGEDEWETASGGGGGGARGSMGESVDGAASGRTLPARSARAKGQSLVGVLATSSSSSDDDGDDDGDQGGAADAGAGPADSRQAASKPAKAPARRGAGSSAAAPPPPPAGARRGSAAAAGGAGGTPERAWPAGADAVTVRRPRRGGRPTASLTPEPLLMDDDASGGGGLSFGSGLEGPRAGAAPSSDDEGWASAEEASASRGRATAASPPSPAAAPRQPLRATAAANSAPASAAGSGAAAAHGRGAAGARKPGLSLGGGARRVTVEVQSDSADGE